MKTATAIFALVLILSASVQASVSFTPPGSSKPMVGNTFTMTPLGEAKKIHSTAKIRAGMSKDKKTWMVDATVTQGHKNGLYVIWLAGKTTKMLGAITKADANGSVKISYMGRSTHGL